MVDDLVKRLRRADTCIFPTERDRCHCGEAADRILELKASLRAIVDDEVPREVAIPYRDDGSPSKHDKCAHHEWMYNHCPYCIMEYAEKKLGEVNAP